MARVLVWTPEATPQDAQTATALEAAVQGLGHAPLRWNAGGTAELRAVLDRSDGVVLVLEGASPDPMAGVVLGLAYAMRRPALVLRSDRRPLDPRFQELLKGVARSVESVTAWEPAVLEPILRPFLSSVRVFAGTLVRDAVPQILEKEGRPLRFRSVEAAAYPHVLKRKLVETTQRLEETEFGLEQEEIADLLELLETLINLRGYDRESLRSIKEGKWRRRGGFERGFLLEEEPKLGQP